MRLHCIIILGLLILSPTFPENPQGSPPPIWVSGLNPADSPRELQLGLPGKPSPQDVVLWQDGRALAWLKAGTLFPDNLPEGSLLEVALKDSAGKPAAGVALQWKLPGMPNLPEPFGRALTNERGEARLHLGPDQGAIVWIEDPRFLPAVTTVAPGASALDLLLTPTPNPVVVVRGLHGRLVAGAKLVTLPLEGFKDLLGMARNRKELQRVVAGDEVGRILIPTDLRHVCGCIQATGYSLLDVPSLDALVGHSAYLVPALTFNVKAKDEESGLPVKDLRWEAQGAPAQLPWLSFKSEGLWAEGEGALTPPSYPCPISLSAPGYVPYKEELKEFPPSGRLDVVLAKGVRLAGKVVTRDGRPVPEALVQAGAFDDHITADSDKDGAFTLPPVPRSMFPLALTVYADDCVEKEIAELPAMDNLALTIVMDGGASITGRVVDEDSHQPISKAKVFCLEKDLGQGYNDTTKEDGGFKVGGLAPGSYEVRFAAVGGVGKARTVTIVGVEPHDLGEIGLSGHPQVTGHLVDKEGNAVGRDAEVHLECYVGISEFRDKDRATTLPGTLEDDGAFKVRGVPSGRYRLVASAGGAKKVLKSVIVDQADMDVGKLALEPTASLRGTLRARTPLDLSSWRVSLLTQRFDRDPVTSFADETGAFSFEDLPAGTYRLVAYAPLHVLPDAMARVELQAGQDAQVVVPVGGVMVTAFVQVDGRPAPGATVTVSGISDEAFDGSIVVLITDSGEKTPLGLPAVTRTGTADAAGRIVLDAVEPGPAQVSLVQSGQYFKAVTTIPDNPQTPLNWNFSGLVLTGHVTGVDGTPAVHVLVSLAYQGVGIMAGNGLGSDASGAFRFTGLGEGTVTLTARSDSGAIASSTVQLKANQLPPPVDLQLGAPPGQPTP